MRHLSPGQCYRSRLSGCHQGQLAFFVDHFAQADVQPSELAPSSSALLAELIPKYLDPEGYAVVLGAVDETSKLIEEQWGHSKLATADDLSS